MTSGVEQLGLSSRPLSGVLVNQPPIQITEAAAKELQLRDGQIVKALVEHGGKHLLLSANERSFRLPVGSIYSAGATLSLRYATSIYGKHLLPASQPSSSKNVSLARPPTATASPSGLVQLALSYLGKLNSVGLGSQDLASILGVSGFGVLVDKSRDKGIGISEKLQLPQFPSKSYTITPRLVADALLHSGLFSESILTDKSRGRLDIKQTLLWLREAYSQDIDQIAKISGAIDAIELAQIESLIAQERREVLYRFAFPFQEGSSVQVEIEGRNQDRNKGGRSWSIALDTIDPSLGDVSVKASLLDKGALDITFWADRPGTASLMKNMLSELTFELERYQITTTNTNVIIGRRVRENSPSNAEGQGSFLDLET